MRKLATIAVALAAGTAYGIGVGAGGFAGVALPVGDMAEDLKMSPEFGGKLLIGPIPALDIEVAFGYHLNHPNKENAEVGTKEPETTVIPITAGARYKFSVDPKAAYYVCGGAGYYRMNRGVVTYLSFLPDPVNYGGEVTLNKPGLYFGGGFLYSFGNFALDVNPRFNYVMNTGDYTVEFDFTRKGWRYIGWVTQEKDYKDTYFDFVAGVNYYFM